MQTKRAAFGHFPVKSEVWEQHPTVRLCRKSRRSKLLHAMVLLRLGLVHKKVLLFVNSINEGFRLRLCLEAFGIRSAVINAALPLNSRHHIHCLSSMSLMHASVC